MNWKQYPTKWRSHVWDHELPSDHLPLTFVTPDLKFDYGATTQTLDLPGEGALILRMTAQSLIGRVGISVARHNGSALLSKETCLTPEQGETQIYFRLSANSLPACFLVRNYDDQDVSGKAIVTECQTARKRDPLWAPKRDPFFTVFERRGA